VLVLQTDSRTVSAVQDRDRDRVHFPVRDIKSRYVISHPGQLSLAIPSWVDAMTEYQPKGDDALRPVSKSRYNTKTAIFT